MSTYELDDKIVFYASIGFLSSREDSSTMEELGFTQDELDIRTDDEIELDLQIMHEDWLANFADMGWHKEE